MNKLVSYVTGYTQNKILFYMNMKKFALYDYVNSVFNYGCCKKEIKCAWCRFYYLSSKWNAILAQRGEEYWELELLWIAWMETFSW